MSRCGCCQRCYKQGAGHNEEDEPSPFDFHLLEASDGWLKVSFRAPRGRRCLRGQRERSDFIISVLGGPDGDLRGPREERLQNIGSGERVVHRVAELIPETEYTVRLSMVVPEHRRAVQESLEVRTAERAMPRPQLQDPKDTKKESSKACADDASTAAPSDAHADDLCRQLTESTLCSEHEGSAPATSSGLAAEQAPAGSGAVNGAGLCGDHAQQPSCVPTTVSEPITSATSGDDGSGAATVRETSDELGAAWGLCPLFFGCQRLPTSPVSQNEIVVEHANDTHRTASMQEELAEERPQPARYRIPFPGTPVDPASVGLGHLELWPTELTTAQQQRLRGRGEYTRTL